MTGVIQYVNPEGTCPAQGLYSHATLVQSDKFAFVAGQLSVDLDGKVVGEENFAAQFRQVFDNVAAVISGLGSSHNNIVKFTTFLTRHEDIDQFMELRAEYFPKIFSGDLFPPNTLLVVRRLVKPEFMIEVEFTLGLGH